MKKFRTLLLMLLALAMILSLASCVPEDAGENSSDVTTEATETEPEVNYTADELFDKIDKKMDSYDSYESTISMTMNVTINGVEVSTKANGVDIKRGLTTGNFEFYTEMKTSVSSPSLSSAQKMTTIEAYHEGNYFISNSGDGVKQKLYSPMLKEDAFERAEDSGTDPFKYNDCANKELVKNEDGTYELTYSGYPAETVDEIVEEFGLDSVMLNADIVDAKVNLKADADFNATVLNFSLVFSDVADGGKAPEIFISVTYTKLGEAELKTSAINPENYTKVDDIRLIDEMVELLADRMGADSGEFDLTVSQSVMVMGQSQYSKEIDHVVYGNGSNGYFYEIDADMNGTKYDIDYSNGSQNITTGGQTQQSAQTEAAARAFVEGLINSSQFDGVSVTDITKVSDNEYQFTCEPKATYEAVFEAMGAQYRSVKQTVTFTLKDGKIVKIDSNADAKGYFTQGNNTYQVSLTVQSEVVFVK